MSRSPDELTTAVCDALHSLPSLHKASFLLDTALALIQAGRYGPEVENYLEVYLRTPNLPKADIARALLARGNARKSGGECLLMKAQQGKYQLLIAMVTATPPHRSEKGWHI
ncbi:hypothetical protein H0H81_012400 [Sphagnurus paluster]|uniref:Uncharacterized protein n=1 Tax=Sphagnurus paluster TaxID=117069 RepID=A0A9P7GKU8_9AGAR|nr:hypothetical protein H0H81_012400 [Sphagnurus paluster]